jgi:hypothetical protein
MFLVIIHKLNLIMIYDDSNNHMEFVIVIN